MEGKAKEWQGRLKEKAKCHEFALDKGKGIRNVVSRADNELPG